MPDDPQLLTAFVRTGSPEAFRDLVGRHIDLVYAAARRQTHDSHDAEDITQAVFIILAQKARAVPSAALLPVWLLKITHFAAADCRRSAARRQKHEQEAAAMLPTTAPEPDPEWDRISPHLDAALAHLSPTDRAAVIAHCLQDRSIAQIAASLNLSEPAARKRVQRALQRLRSLLEPQTKSPPPTFLALPLLLTAHALTPAPPALASAITTTALAALHGTLATTTAFTLAKGVTHMMFLAKAKLAFGLAMAIVILGTLTGTTVHYALAQAATVVTAAPARLPATTTGATAPVGVAGTIMYRGVLVDSVGKAVPNAAVRAYILDHEGLGDRLEWKGKTAADGTFAVGPLADAMRDDFTNRVLLFDAPGLALAWRWETTIGFFDDPAAIRVTAGRPTEVAGTLTNARGKPVANAMVDASIAPKDGGYFRFNPVTGLTVTSDGQGKFRLSRIPENTRLQLTVRHPDYQTWSTQFRRGDSSSIFPVAAGTADADIQLEDRPAMIRVQLVRGGKPVAKAGFTFVALNRASGVTMEITQSNAEGRAEFAGLSAGTWIVRTPALQEYPQALVMPVASITLSVGETRDVSAEMSTIAVRGTVLEGDSDLPAKQTALVSASTVDPKLYVGAAKPDAKGRFELLLPPGRYELSCTSWEAGEYTTVAQEFLVAADSAVPDLVVRVHSWPALRGQLVDSAGKPLSGLVALDNHTHARAGADGRFSIAVRPIGPTTQMTGVAVDSGRTLARSFLTQLAKPNDPELRLVLEPMGTITGRALDQAGRPLPDTRVELFTPDANGFHVQLENWIWRTTVEDDGTFVVTNVPTGNRMDFSLHDRDQFALTRMALKPGETRHLGDIVLHGAIGTTQATIRAARTLRPNPALALPPREVWDATITGRVLDPSGKPVVGMKLYARMTAENRPTVQFEEDGVSDLKGRFTMAGFPHNRTVRLMGNVHDGAGQYAWDIMPGSTPVELRLSAEAKAAATQP